jgi:hypothetical protein
VRERVPWGYWNGKFFGNAGDDHFLGGSRQQFTEEEEEMWRISGGRGERSFVAALAVGMKM